MAYGGENQRHPPNMADISALKNAVGLAIQNNIRKRGRSVADGLKAGYTVDNGQFLSSIDFDDYQRPVSTETLENRTEHEVEGSIKIKRTRNTNTRSGGQVSVSGNASWNGSSNSSASGQVDMDCQSKAEVVDNTQVEQQPLRARTNVRVDRRRGNAVTTQQVRISALADSEILVTLDKNMKWRWAGYGAAGGAGAGFAVGVAKGIALWKGVALAVFMSASGAGVVVGGAACLVGGAACLAGVAGYGAGRHYTETFTITVRDIFSNLPGYVEENGRVYGLVSVSTCGEILIERALHLKNSHQQQSNDHGQPLSRAHGQDRVPLQGGEGDLALTQDHPHGLVRRRNAPT